MRHFLQNTGIVKKMTGALLVMVLLTLMLSGFALHKLSAINNHTLAMEENWLVSIRLLGQIKGLLAEGKYNVISHLQSTSSMGAKRVESKFRADEEDLLELWKNYQKTSHNEQEKSLSTDFTNKHTAYVKAVENVLQLSRDNNKEEARILFLNTTLPAIIETQESLERLIEHHSSGAANTTKLANSIYQQAWQQIVALFVLICICSYALIRLIQSTLLQPVIRQTQTLSTLAAGDSSARVNDTERGDEIGDMARALHQLKTSVAQQQQSAWIKTQVANITGTLQNESDIPGYAQQLLGLLAPVLGAQVATMYYQAPHQPFFACVGGYCLPSNQRYQEFALGEGLIGQCAKNQQLMRIHNVPDDYLITESGTLTIKTQELRLIPIVFPNERVAAVLELAFVTKMTAQGELLVDDIVSRIAMQLKILERQGTTA